MAVAAERARMDPTDLSDAQLDQLAQRLAPHLPTGTHGDNVILSRRAFAAAVGGTLGASGLVALGVDPAAAQAAGQVGTSADPVDAFVYDLDVANALQSDLDAGGNSLTNVGSLSTGNSTKDSESYSLGDDESVDTYANNADHSLVFMSGDGSNNHALFTLQFNGITIAMIGSNVTDQSNSDLTGTTGPDGSVNISQSSSILQVENRTGDPIEFDIVALSRAGD